MPELVSIIPFYTKICPSSVSCVEVDFKTPNQGILWIVIMVQISLYINYYTFTIFMTFLIY